jgi:tRNA pseudouridine38-40 synthase
MTVAYDGTDFVGFQVQIGQRTVQGVLEEAIARVTGLPVRVAGAGRTDAGVHATGQVVTFPTESSLAPAVVQRATNGVLAEDVVVLDAAEAASGFHARFSARARGYRYTIWNAAPRPIFDRRYVFLWRSFLDAAAMDKAARLLVGRHDFAAFGGTFRGRERPTSTIRTLYRLHCWRDGERVVVDAAADAFLPHMVRNLVGTLIPVGMGSTTAKDVRAVLDGRDRRRAGVTVPPQGLCLTKVWYD